MKEGWSAFKHELVFSTKSHIWSVKPVIKDGTILYEVTAKEIISDSFVGDPIYFEDLHRAIKNIEQHEED